MFLIYHTVPKWNCFRRALLCLFAGLRENEGEREREREEWKRMFD